MAALTRNETGHLLDGGVVHTLGTWEPYALIVGGPAPCCSPRAPFTRGPAPVAPTLTVAQPLVAVLIGLIFFGEHINSGGPAPAWEGLGLVLVVAGVFALTRSPVIGADQTRSRRAHRGWARALVTPWP